jgi:hypothetical protein
MKRASLLLLCLPVGLLARSAHAQAAGPDSLTQTARYQQVGGGHLGGGTLPTSPGMGRPNL